MYPGSESVLFPAYGEIDLGSLAPPGTIPAGPITAFRVYCRVRLSSIIDMRYGPNLSGVSLVRRTSQATCESPPSVGVVHLLPPRL